MSGTSDGLRGSAILVHGTWSNPGDFRPVDDDHFVLFNSPQTVADVVLEALAPLPSAATTA
jgi:hypothetical protein